MQVDLTDPEFHRHARAIAIATDEALRDLITEAVAAGKLIPGADVGALARTVQAVLGGSRIT